MYKVAQLNFYDDYRLYKPYKDYETALSEVPKNFCEIHPEHGPVKTICIFDPDNPRTTVYEIKEV